MKVGQQRGECERSHGARARVCAVPFPVTDRVGVVLCKIPRQSIPKTVRTVKYYGQLVKRFVI